jgi:hypothetical protein
LKEHRLLLPLAIATVLTAVAVSEAAAQNRNGQWRSPSRAAGRQATLPKREERPPVVIVPSQGGSLLNPVYRIPAIIVPAVLLFDGSVFANFGFGFEPILPLCGGVAKMGAVVASNGVVLQPAPPSNPYGPSAQHVLTRSQLIATGVPVHQVVVSDVGRLACFNRDGGLVYVYR